MHGVCSLPHLSPRFHKPVLAKPTQPSCRRSTTHCNQPTSQAQRVNTTTEGTQQPVIEVEETHVRTRPHETKQRNLRARAHGQRRERTPTPRAATLPSLVFFRSYVPSLYCCLSTTRSSTASVVVDRSFVPRRAASHAAAALTDSEVNDCERGSVGAWCRVLWRNQLEWLRVTVIGICRW